MADSPTIIVLKKDLDKNKELILNGNWQLPRTKENKADQKTMGGEFNKTVMEYIKWQYEESKPFSVGGLTLIIMKPSLSAFNRAVRTKLLKMGIDYGLHY